MFGLNGGEFALVAFIVAAILTARYWPRIGERVALWFVRDEAPRD